MEFKNDLPEGITDWVAKTGKGEITRLERHVACREAWVVDVTAKDGSVLQGFLRLEPRASAPQPVVAGERDQDHRGTGQDERPCARDVRTQREARVHAVRTGPGRSDLDRITYERQQPAVMEHFMEVVGEMHDLDLAELGLDRYMAYKPTTPAEAALGEVDLILRQWKDFLKMYRDPLITFGVQWLRNYVPKTMARVSLVQGDTGPVNFMFDADRVSAVIDFEWGHYGDPMEDLGNICVREFLEPVGWAQGPVQVVRAVVGDPVRPRRDHVLPSPAERARHDPDPRGHRDGPSSEPVAWFLAYRYIGDRATCEALSEAMDIPIDKPEMPAEDVAIDPLAEAARYALANDVAPNVSGAFAQSRANDVNVLIDCMDRRRRYAATLAEIERDELSTLLGRKPKSAADGLRKLDVAIRKGTVDDASTLRYLTRRAYRDEWLYAPAVTLYPQRNWSPID